MQTMTPPRAGRVIFRDGLIFGVLLGTAHIALSLFNGLLVQSGIAILGSLLIVLLWLGAFFWVGVRGAKQTGRVGTGSLVGLVAAVTAGTMAFLALLMYISINMSTVISIFQQVADASGRQGTRAIITSSSIMNGAIIIGVLLWLLGIGVGTGLGTLGGLLGQSLSTVLPSVHTTYQYPMQLPYPPPYAPPPQSQAPQWPNQPPV
jgi:hypothetical protein